MTLGDLLERFFLDRECRPNYAMSLRRTVRRATAYGLTEVCQLSNESINEFLCSLVDFAAETRCNYRRELCTIFRFAHELGLTDELPTRVRRVRIARAPARAWSLDDIARMQDAAAADVTPVGGLHNLRVCDLLPAWIRVGYETGLRFTDILELRKSCLRRSTLSVTENKTGKVASFSLTDDTVKHLIELESISPDDSFFLWALTRRRAFLLWRKFLDRNGFEGTSKWLRRSAATYIESQRVGGATAFLRHSAPHLARVHYIDASLLAPPLAPTPLPAVRAG